VGPKKVAGSRPPVFSFIFSSKASLSLSRINWDNEYIKNGLEKINLF